MEHAGAVVEQARFFVVGQALVADLVEGDARSVAEAVVGGDRDQRVVLGQGRAGVVVGLIVVLAVAVGVAVAVEVDQPLGVGPVVVVVDDDGVVGDVDLAVARDVFEDPAVAVDLALAVGSGGGVAWLREVGRVPGVNGTGVTGWGWRG